MAEDNGGRIRAIYLRTDDNKYSAVLGMYGTWIDWSVFDNNVKSAPIIKVLYQSIDSAGQFKVILSKILNDSEAQPIEMSFHPWNKELGKAEFRSSIKVGRDNEKCIYFEFVGDTHKEPIRMYLVIDKGYQIQNMALPKSSLSESGARAIIEALTTLIRQAILATQNRVPKSSITPDSSSPMQHSVGNDVPF